MVIEYYLAVERLSEAFEEIYAYFVQTGGLDEIPKVTEDFERVYRQAVCCIHGGKRRDCPICYKAPKPYFPAGPYDGN